MSAYKNQCCVTVDHQFNRCFGSKSYFPYRGPDTNHIQNGIPLRVDIHKLWTKGLLGINNKYQIVLNDTARNSESYKNIMECILNFQKSKISSR